MLKFSSAVDVVQCIHCSPTPHRAHILPNGEHMDAALFEYAAKAPSVPYVLVIQECLAGEWVVQPQKGWPRQVCSKNRSFPACYLGPEWDGKHVTVSFQTKEV